MKILITEVESLVRNNDISLECFDTLADEVVLYSNITRDELLKEIADTDIVLCNKALIDREVILASRQLKYIGTFATGYNNIDLVTAKENGIRVCNAAGYSTNGVVQQVIGYILLHYTKITQYNEFVQSGGWCKANIFSPLQFESEEVCGKTLGIVGYGTIGKAVAKVAKALGMKVLAYTRTVKVDEDVTFTDFDSLLSLSDVVSLHCPLNEGTANLMNEESFSKMKDGAFFINTSRGGTVVEEALAKALKSGKLSGAAVDVLRQEPMSEDCPLKGIDNLIITSHSAWSALSTRRRLVLQVYDNLKAFLEGNPQNVIL